MSLAGSLRAMMEVAAGTVLVFSDIGCPWAHLAVHRLHEARARLGLETEVSFDMRAFPLELINEEPTPKEVLDAEIPVVGGLDISSGLSLWRNRSWRYPVTMLPAMEAVYAAKEQGLGLSDRLDRSLRVAFFRDSRCISVPSEILDVATGVPGLDVAALGRGLTEGSYRRLIHEDRARAEGAEVKGSPHVFVPGGRSFHNPGIEMRWEGEKPRGFPVVEDDQPEIYAGLIEAAAR